MARFYPHPLPPEVVDDPRRAGERRVFEALKDGLNDDWLVLANVSWLRPRYEGGLHEGEADAVLAHPDKGIVVLEVKGGGIRRDGDSGQWFSRDRHAVDHEIKDPFHQARRSLFALRNMLAEEVSQRFISVPVASGVAFPDLPAPAKVLGPDAPLECCIFAEQLADVSHSLEKLLAYSNQTARTVGPGAELVADIRQMLMPALNLDVPLSIRIRDDEEVLIKLTEDQKRVLAMLSRLRRVAVTGGAGTGKTVLAVEKLRQLARQGADVLYLCFNNGLARTVAAQCADAENVAVHTFHGLCTEWARQADLLPPMPAHPIPSSHFEEVLPNALLEAIDRVERRFDAVVVDEGQDFREDWWTHVQLITKEPGESILYVFYDDNQRIYRAGSGIPADLVPIALDENVRNTRAIHDAAAALHAGEQFTCNGPKGSPVELVEVPEDKPVEREVRRLLHRLIREEGVKPDDIAILSSRSLERSQVGRDGHIGDFELARLHDARQGAVVRESIQRFKGLERPVVILVELDTAIERHEILYVGLTRARSYLAIVDRPDTLAEIRRLTGL